MPRFLLDTNHLTLLEQQQVPLMTRFLRERADVVTGIVNVQEVLKGRLAALAVARKAADFIRGYELLELSVSTISQVPILPYDAIAEGAFTLFYQPIVSLDTAKPYATPRVEALLRMSETGGELILPMNFIPVAERYDLMRTIDRWVVERAFSDFRRLAKLRGDNAPAYSSAAAVVNVLPSGARYGCFGRCTMAGGMSRPIAFFSRYFSFSVFMRRRSGSRPANSRTR